MIVKVTFTSASDESVGRTKLLEISGSYDDVWEAVSEVFPGASKIEWKDEDGDLILIESQADLDMWMRMGSPSVPSVPSVRRWFVSGPTSPTSLAREVESPSGTTLPPPSLGRTIRQDSIGPAGRMIESLPVLTRPPVQEYVPRGVPGPTPAIPPTLPPASGPASGPTLPPTPGPLVGNQRKVVALPRLNARFVKHVTCDDEQSTYAPGTKFFKTWRFRNDGSLRWPRLINLIYVSKLTGDQLDGPDVLSVTFPEQIEIGEEVDLTVPLVAPGKTGEYSGFWKLGDETGKKFGQRVRVRIQVDDPESKPALTKSQLAILEEMAEDGWRSALGTIKLLLRRGAKTAGDVESALKKLGIRASLND